MTTKYKEVEQGFATPSGCVVSAFLTLINHMMRGGYGMRPYVSATAILSMATVYEEVSMGTPIQKMVPVVTSDRLTVSHADKLQAGDEIAALPNQETTMRINWRDEDPSILRARIKSKSADVGASPTYARLHDIVATYHLEHDSAPPTEAVRLAEVDLRGIADQMAQDMQARMDWYYGIDQWMRGVRRTNDAPQTS